MEMHLVHKSEAGELAVIGVFIEEGTHNDAFDAVWNNMPTEPGTEARIENVREDSDLKRAQSAKTRVEGMQTAVEAGETVQEAKRIIEEKSNGDSGGAEEGESGVEVEAEYEGDD